MGFSKKSINKRFTEAVNYLIQNNNQLNKTTIAKTLGISKSKFSEILNNRMNAGLDIIPVFCTNYSIDMQWILTGEGEMLSQSTVQETFLTTDKNKYEEINYNANNFPPRPYLDSLYDILGSPNLFSMALEQKCFGSIQVPFLNDYDFFLRGRGDSMVNRNNPKRSICDSDLVACKLLKNRSYIRWGEVYALATTDEIVIKKVVPSNLKGYVKCISFNEEEGYNPYDMPLSEILDWALVVGVASINTW